MTEETRDPIADWHAQFAPAPFGAVEGEARPELAGQVAVEHFADADGVFTAPEPVAEEETADAPAEDAPKAKGRRGEAESAP